jgi:hypothetical protein
MIRLNKKNINRITPPRYNEYLVRTASTVFVLITIIMAASTTVMIHVEATTDTTETTATSTPPINTPTDNESVNVIIDWEPTEIEPEQEIEFTFEFQDPSSGESLSHVNYDLEIIEDESGETVESVTERHSHSGSDEQSMTFDNAGDFSVEVTVIGTGVNPPFDTTYSGTAETIINVGSEEEVPATPTEEDTSATATTANQDNNTTTTTSVQSELFEFSPQPIWQERIETTNIIQINETHSIAEFEGNGNITVPDTGETINMTSNGSSIGGILPGTNDTISSYGREYVFSEDNGDSTAITFFEIVQYDSETLAGKGLIIAVFDRNATGTLAPFNGMMLAGIHEEQPNADGTTITLWEWQGGIELPSQLATTTATTTEDT